VFHIARESGRENNPSLIYTILCALVVMKNPTNKCIISQKINPEAPLFMTD
jgi:hypothetical protein